LQRYSLSARWRYHGAVSSIEMRVVFNSLVSSICGILLTALLKESVAYQYVGHRLEHQHVIDHY